MAAAASVARKFVSLAADLEGDGQGLFAIGLVAHASRVLNGLLCVGTCVEAPASDSQVSTGVDVCGRAYLVALGLSAASQVVRAESGDMPPAHSRRDCSRW